MIRHGNGLYVESVLTRLPRLAAITFFFSDQLAETKAYSNRNSISNISTFINNYPYHMTKKKNRAQWYYPAKNA